MCAILKCSAFKVSSLDTVSVHIPAVRENARTFKGNAEKKARSVSRRAGCLAIADDSGIMVDALKGAPGVRSARFAGNSATDYENNRKLLRMLKGVPEKARRARFVCVIAIAENGEIRKTVRGECRGKIAFAGKGKRGFGYDPLFIPDGYRKTFAELSPMTKNRISHRRKALEKAKAALEKMYGID